MRHARRGLAVAVLIAVGLVLSSAAATAMSGRLRMSEARNATRIAAATLADLLTDTRPQIRVKCRRLTADSASCRMRVRAGDLRAVSRSRVSLTADRQDVQVFLRRLRVLDQPGERHDDVEPTG